MVQPIEFRKKRETGEIITDSLVFIRTEFKPLAKLTALYVFPFLILYTIAQLYLQSKYAGVFDLINKADPEKLVREMGPFYVNLLVTVLFDIFVQSLFLAVVYTYIQAYIFKGRKSFSLSEVTPVFFSNTLITLTTGLAVTAIAVSGLFLCILPGIILANSLSLAVFIAVYERKGFRDALVRSWYLVKSQWWNTFALNIVGIVVIWMTSYFLSIPAFFNHFDMSSQQNMNLSVILSDWRWWNIGLSMLFSSLASIIAFLFWALQYFNLAEREKDRKENT
jgi:hypothetical protein